MMVEGSDLYELLAVAVENGITATGESNIFQQRLRSPFKSVSENDRTLRVAAFLCLCRSLPKSVA